MATFNRTIPPYAPKWGLMVQGAVRTEWCGCPDWSPLATWLSVCKKCGGLRFDRAKPAT